MWASDGGVAANGMRYGPPGYAIPWGDKGCPLLPRAAREHNKGVRLPPELSKILGASLTVDQLDSGALDRFESDTVWDSTPREFRDFLYDMPILATQVAIPAGIPRAWIETLPITGRTRGAVLRAFGKKGSDGFLKEPMLAGQFLRIPSVGVTFLNELTCVIESAELGWSDRDPTTDIDNTTLQQEAIEDELLTDSNALQIIETMSSFNGHVHQMARWAMAETDAQTFGEAVAELLRTEAASEVWKPVAQANLTDLGELPAHPYEVLDKWMDRFDSRSRAIFVGRVSCRTQNIVTLEELGSEFGVTRERIRQVEAKVRRSLRRFLRSDEALPLRWRASTLRRIISVAAPTTTVEHLLRSPPGRNDHRAILLEMAGPYDCDEEWLTLREAQCDDPTSVILTKVDEVGRIDREFATSQLLEWGLDVSLHERWLTRDSSVRLFSGQLVRWGTTISDRLSFALDDMGRPATLDEMVARIGEDRSRNSIINALAVDPRLG